MGGSLAEIATIALAVFAVGLGCGWLLRDAACRRRIAGLTDEWQTGLDELSRAKGRLTAESEKQRERLEQQEGILARRDQAIAKLRTELESAGEREKRLGKDIFTLRAERDEFKTKISQFQKALGSLKQQALDLQSEFSKSRDFYKAELQKSFEKRKDLQARLENARAEHASFANLLESSRSEHDAINKMLASAKARLADMDDLEREVVRLEAENAQLNHDARLTQREVEELKRDVGELEELRVQNKELSHCLQSMEKSRRQYEDDARRYREQVDQTEQRSETLQIRLDEVEKNFAEIRSQQEQALRDARKESRISNGSNGSNGRTSPVREVDDLQEIVGIGKVFERALHDLGIYSFRQIANFGPADIARVNRELKDCKGRMEQDDWIGQAKELLYKKYGAAEAS